MYKRQPKYNMNINDEPTRIANVISNHLSAVLLNSLKSIACVENHIKGNKAKAIILMPVENSRFFKLFSMNF